MILKSKCKLYLQIALKCSRKCSCYFKGLKPTRYWSLLLFAFIQWSHALFTGSKYNTLDWEMVSSLFIHNITSPLLCFTYKKYGIKHYRSKYFEIFIYFSTPCVPSWFSSRGRFTYLQHSRNAIFSLRYRGAQLSLQILSLIYKIKIIISIIGKKCEQLKL